MVCLQLLCKTHTLFRHLSDVQVSDKLQKTEIGCSDGFLRNLFDLPNLEFTLNAKNKLLSISEEWLTLE